MSVVPENKNVLTWTTKQVVFVTIFVVCVFLTFWLLYRLRLVVLLFFVSAILGTAMRPTVEWLHVRFGWSRTTAIITLYAFIGIVLAGFFALVFPLIADQVTQVSHSLPDYYSAARNWLLNSSNRLLQLLGGRIPPQFGILGSPSAEPTTAQLIDRVAQTFFYFNLTAKSLLSIITVLLLAFYWTQESNRILRSLLLLVPLARRKAVREFIDVAETKIGGYVRGQGLLCLAVGTAAFIAYTIIGLPYVLILGIIAGILEMVPIFGPGLGAIPALVVALSVDPTKAIWVVVATGLIQLLENTFLVPRIMKHSMGVNPIIILLSLVGFGSALGFAGALLALPLAAIVQLVIDRVVIEAAVAQASQGRGELEIFMDESQRLLELADGHLIGKDTALKALPVSDREEVRSVIRELDGLLKELKTEEE